MLPGLFRLHLLLYYQMLCGIKYNVIYTVSTKKFDTTFSPDWSGKLKLHVDVWSTARFKLFFSNSVIFILWLMDICKVKTDSWNKWCWMYQDN